MRTETMIYWDEADPFPMGKRVEEAFNRVKNFCPELLVQTDKPSHRPRELVSHNRVTNGCFDKTDCATLTAYAMTVYNRAKERHGDSQEPMSVGIMQAAQNLLDVIKETTDYVMVNLR